MTCSQTPHTGRLKGRTEQNDRGPGDLHLRLPYESALEKPWIEPVPSCRIRLKLTQFMRGSLGRAHRFF